MHKFQLIFMVRNFVPILQRDEEIERKGQKRTQLSQIAYINAFN